MFALTVFLSVLSMVPPLIVRAIIDRVLTDGQRDLFPALAVCMVTIPVLAAGCNFLQTVSIAYLGQRFVFDIRVGLYEHLLTLSSRFFGKNSAGKLVNRVMGDSGIVQKMVTARSISVVSDLVCAMFAVTVTFYLNWRLALLIVVVISSFVANYKFNVGRIRKATRSSRTALDGVSSGIQNRLGGSLAVKTFGTEDREHDEFRVDSDTTLALTEEAFVANNAFSMNTQLIQAVGQSTIYFAGCAFVLRGELSYGDVMAFATYAMRLLGPAVRFSEIVREIQNVSIAIERMFEVFGESPEIRDEPDSVPVDRLSGRVDFDDVHFHYEEGTPVLRGFDLHVESGETIALIGPTGCGKSTVLSLLMRFFDVTEGTLSMDGTDVRQLRLKDLRRQFGIVLQDPLLFSVSVADNIRYARPSATFDDVQAAAKVAEINDFIMTLPDGYDTIVGADGVELSLGQKQRVTIARAVIADPAILIMDEATSALDSDSEQAIQRTMDHVLQGRTCFVVAHRLSTIRNANRIVLLEDGGIAEIGNHQQLMARPNGKYRRLYTQHMGEGVLDI